MSDRTLQSCQATGAIIWDFDGTLAVRGSLQWRGALVEVLDALEPGHGVDVELIRPALRDRFPWHAPEKPHLHLSDPDKWWEAIAERFEAAFQAGGIPAARARELAGAVRARYVDPKAGWLVFDDVRPMLERLTGEGWRHLILSNHVPELPAIVAALGLDRHVSAVLSSALTGYEKPHPQAYALAREAAGTDRLWMIGDNVEADVLGAEAVGIPAILVRSPDPRATRFARSLDEIPAILSAGFPTARTHLPRVRKVLAYVVREGQLLVFRHLDFPEAGLQVPAGTLLDGESPEAGVLRETEEETGHRGFRIRRGLGSYEHIFRDSVRHEIHQRHVFELGAPPGLPDNWTHLAEEGSGDFWFDFSWVGFAEDPGLESYQSDFLPLLRG